MYITIRFGIVTNLGAGRFWVRLHLSVKWGPNV